ncbi:ATP-binding protein [Intrasporangium sp.]|uniref:ATP-binding protein n=1 Tax=Intrasporangium sp. TaxID=1925024 RepID=UPI003221B79A
MISDEVATALRQVADGMAAADLESQHLEFKTVGRSAEDTMVNLADACSCFANADGGTVVVGVRDGNGGPEAFVGSPLDPVRTQRRIHELTDPGLIVTVESETWQGIDLTVISVPRSPTVHQVRHRSTERLGSSCVSMSAIRIAAVMRDRGGYDWSAAASGSRIDDVDDVAVGLVRRRLREVPAQERQLWADQPVAVLLARLGLLTADRQLNNAGAVLLTDMGRTHFRYIRKTSMSGELTANEDVRGTGVEALSAIEDFVLRGMTHTPVNLPHAQQLLIADVPESAVREVLVNAFMHRDHGLGDATFVEHSPEWLRVSSPGGFVVGVTAQTVLTAPARSRNPVLAQAVRAIGLAEAAGVGIERVYVAMAEVGHRLPVFASDARSVSVSLYGGAPEDDVVKFVATLPDDLRRDPVALIVLDALRMERTTTAHALAPVLQRDEDEAEALLRQLAARGELIEATRNSARLRRSTYRLTKPVIDALGSSLAYRRPTADDLVSTQIVAMVRAYGEVNARAVRAVFDVSAATASRYLADLVAREILVKTSTASRGPSVTYGMGPKFPRATRGSRPRGTTASTEEQQEMTAHE